MDGKLTGKAYVADEFLHDYDKFRRYLDHVDYKGETNPADGVFYPGVSTRIPEYFRSQVRLGIGEPKYLFLRLSPEGIATPHQAHHDIIMAKYTAVIYLNREEDCQGGTSVVTHKEYGDDIPQEVWRRDTNNPNKWSVENMFEMKPNRLVMYPSETWHRSEPVGGFGTNAADGRLVMVGFFDELTSSDIRRHLTDGEDR